MHGNMIDRRRLCRSLLGFGLASRSIAQPRPKLVGGLFPYSRKDAEDISGSLVAAMGKLGYVSGRDFTYIYRAADGRDERLPALAKELVQLKPDLLIAATTNGASAARGAAGRIPIVFYAVADPVRSGFADSLSQPGHNMTGVSNVGASLDSKRLDLLKQMVPSLERVAYLLNPTNPFYSETAQSYHVLAARFGLRAVTADASKAEDLASAFRDIAAFRAQAMMVMGDSFLYRHTDEIAALSASHHLPSIWPFGDSARAKGALMGYGASTEGLELQVAACVDKIFRGAKPENIPIAGPIEFNLVINRTTAEMLKIEIPPPLLLQATLVVE